MHGSVANGPGIRNVLHVQGCTIGCKGCFNPHTWNPSQGDSMRTDKVAHDLLKGMSPSPGGITVSGGEPMEQWEEVFEVINLVKETASYGGLLPSVVMFTGWEPSALESFGYNKLSEYIDAIVSGPYVEGLKRDGFLASKNQELIILTNVLSEEDFETDRVIEITCEGSEVTITGFPTREERRSILEEIN